MVMRADGGGRLGNKKIQWYFFRKKGPRKERNNNFGQSRGWNFLAYWVGEGEWKTKEKSRETQA